MVHDRVQTLVAILMAPMQVNTALRSPKPTCPITIDLLNILFGSEWVSLEAEANGLPSLQVSMLLRAAAGDARRPGSYLQVPVLVPAVTCA